MTAQPLWRVCRHADFDDPAITDEILRCHTTPRHHRKQWEYALVLGTARRLGLIRAGARALGLGVGREPVVAVLAADGMAVTATELDRIGLARTPPMNPPPAMAARIRGLNDRQILPDAAFDAAVTFGYRDAAAPAGADAGRFDLVWSCSLLHQMSGPEAALAALAASRDRLAPGGWALHTFDILLESGPGAVLGGAWFPGTDDVNAWHDRFATPGSPAPDLGPGTDPRDRIPDRGEPGAPHICVTAWDRLIGTAAIALPAALPAAGAAR
jgi:hypothetical protein